MAEMIWQKFEITGEDNPKAIKFCSTYRDIWDIEIRVIESFLPNIVRDDQGTKDFVWAFEKFEKLSIWVFESLLYRFSNKAYNLKLVTWLKGHVA